MTAASDILQKSSLDFNDIVRLLSTDDPTEQQLIFDKALEIKAKTIGRNVYLRGLIELSNICRKDCLYCGIRKSNEKAVRYSLTHEEVMQSAAFTNDNGFGSIVIQSGELLGENFIHELEDLIREIHQTYPDLLITLSCGEESLDTYKRWFDAGASRYLLRIESSDRDLYYKIHPKDTFHSFENRLQALDNLRTAGYQVGTGVMIGLPKQSIEILAKDLLFFKQLDVDMVGMGPFIEHSETPLYAKRDILWPLQKRFEKSLLMIAVLRIMMPTINIASSTALESLDPKGRQKGLLAGANVVMPNVTPLAKKINYKLYEKKPGLFLDATQSLKSIRESIEACGEHICLHNPGIPKHFSDRKEKNGKI
jgi:iron-only hydrogenase maturation rSAM protein HydE